MQHGDVARGALAAHLLPAAARPATGATLPVWRDPQSRQGVDVNLKSQSGQAPLHDAAGNGDCRCAQALIRAGAQVDLADAVSGMDAGRVLGAHHRRPRRLGLAAVQNGNTPLHYACFFGHPEVARLLVGAGADLGLQNTDRHTPLHAAMHNRHAAVVQYLAEAHAPLETKAAAGDAPLHKARAAAGLGQCDARCPRATLRAQRSASGPPPRRGLRQDPARRRADVNAARDDGASRCTWREDGQAGIADPCLREVPTIASRRRYVRARTHALPLLSAPSWCPDGTARRS